MDYRAFYDGYDRLSLQRMARSLGMPAMACHVAKKSQLARFVSSCWRPGRNPDDYLFSNLKSTTPTPDARDRARNYVARHRGIRRAQK